MPAPVHLLLIAVAAGALLLALVPLLRIYRKTLGQQIDVHDAASLELDPMDAAFNALLRSREVNLRSCSRWSDKGGCGQCCMAQVEATRDGCLVRDVLAAWYDGTSCTLCQKQLSVDFERHKPALMTPDRITMDWADLRVEDMHEVLETHSPVCWNCHIVETMSRMHPALMPESRPRPDLETV